jgi:hypothetical protein
MFCSVDWKNGFEGGTYPTRLRGITKELDIEFPGLELNPTLFEFDEFIGGFTNYNFVETK